MLTYIQFKYLLNTYDTGPYMGTITSYISEN